MIPAPSNPTDWPLVCLRCGSELTTGEGSFYVVKIEAYADPSPPTITGDEDPGSIAVEFDALVAQLSELSEQELMDQVYRRMVVLLCRRCYTSWIDNPVG